MNFPWHQNLLSVINKGYLKTSHAILWHFEQYYSLIVPRRVKEKSHQLVDRKTIEIKPFKRLPDYLISLPDSIASINKDLESVIILGSAADGLMTPFSDIDALAIIKDDSLNDKSRARNVIKSLRTALAIFYKFDPLQHHGWFILTSSMLSAYPKLYLPLEVLQNGKCLFPEAGGIFNVGSREFEEFDYQSPFFNLADTVLKKALTRNQHRNVYQLKGFLSQFMLLPSLYCQARDGKSIYKAESFAAARTDFNERVWCIMDQVSLLRELWQYKISPVQRFMLIQINPALQYFRPYYAPAPIEAISQYLENPFYDDAITLIQTMKARIAEA